MPELPEVETIRRDLEKFLIGKKVEKIRVEDSKVVIGSKKTWEKALLDKELEQIQRRGKLLAFLFTGDVYILIHLKMTGQLIYQQKSHLVAGGHPFSRKSQEEAIGGSLPNKFSRLIIEFNGGKLFFNDIRRFGYAKLTDDKGWEKAKEKFGLEPLTKNFKLKDFKALFTNRKAPIKAVLLNQSLIAGLGNIYVDESLFFSGIDPRRKAFKLKDKEKDRLFQVIVKVLKQAISKRGTTFSNYRDSQGEKGNFSSQLKVYGREGEKCFKCNGLVEKIKVAGRGTHFCPKCQK
ncbi:MAG: bifunctional DNA-formamidopyrimidine glycosylase/DNA-(apurinic or apyrimidinic site) lyase [Candidatus Pacebacteria bacterium]|nr:bifunctional DNA-formamidopyrimidine glycosylase/DNA-(apurinic or apyrimidinic site) lyase [Candidatus Paceibacterota bacterium]